MESKKLIHSRDVQFNENKDNVKECEEESPELGVEKYVFNVCNDTENIGSQEPPEDPDDSGAPEEPDQPKHLDLAQQNEAEAEVL